MHSSTLVVILRNYQKFIGMITFIRLGTIVYCIYLIIPDTGSFQLFMKCISRLTCGCGYYQGHKHINLNIKFIKPGGYHSKQAG
jgi:hypothetical protein